jgi:hypothetical protein
VGLRVDIGTLARCNKHRDQDTSEYIRETLAVANELLAAAGLPAHLEPERIEGIELIADFRPRILEYSSIYRLGRVAAKRRLQMEWLPTAAGEAEDPRDDPDVQRAVASSDFHLLTNVDGEGIYVPVAFDNVLSNAEGFTFGSSYKLLAELVEVAPGFDIHVGADGEFGNAELSRVAKLADDERAPMRRELLAWLSFYKGARLSIKHRTALWSRLS